LIFHWEDPLVLDPQSDNQLSQALSLMQYIATAWLLCVIAFTPYKKHCIKKHCL
jgi:hypothetical protein